MKRFYCFCLMIFLSWISVAKCIAHPLDDSLIKKNVIIEGRFKAGIWEAVHLLANKGIPIGFEGREHLSIDTEDSIILRSGTVEEILDSIVNQDIFYTWEEREGVINIYPVMDRDKEIESLLNTNCGPIKILSIDDRASTVGKIGDLFTSISSRKDIKFFPVIGKENSLGLPNKIKEDLNIPKSSLKSVLNLITRNQTFVPLWTIKPSPDGKEFDVVF